MSSSCLRHMLELCISVFSFLCNVLWTDTFPSFSAHCYRCSVSKTDSIVLHLFHHDIYSCTLPYICQQFIFPSASLKRIYNGQWNNFPLKTKRQWCEREQVVILPSTVIKTPNISYAFIGPEMVIRNNSEP